VQPVLIENGGKGHSDAFAPIMVEGAARGSYGKARITGFTDKYLTGTFA
jgi:threonylcarbamoyladenosine tRNA methylthiotransferase MtaB